ncbi:hypothetical protein ACFHWD_03425 [Clostridium sp. MT-14]|uniref:hypothetical protein n=1 Tax=Clostridium sp. MT-14 TaxID=3348360 RepID=UPI0035F32163
MDKYLYVEFINNWDCYICQYTGEDIPVTRRIAKIKLTEEQIKQLEPKIVGTSNNKNIYEDRRLICIQEEGDKGNNKN